MVIAPFGSLTAAVEHASAVLASDPATAQREAEAILALSPRDPRALLVLASAQRRQGHPAAALSILLPLAKAYPRAAHTQYELGCTLVAQNQPARAMAALRQATALKPDLAEAWRALGQLLFAQGDNPAADAAFAASDRALVRDPALAPAAEALYRGRLQEAEQRLRNLLTARPNDVAALWLMAQTLGRLGRHRDAGTLLDHALRLEPAHDGARLAYANALFQQQKTAEAIAELQPLLDRHPSEPTYLNLLAGCLTLLGDLKRVIAIYETLLTDYPRQPKIWLNYGHALRTVGKRSDAVAAYRQAIALSPDYGEAYWSLADLKVEPLSLDDEKAIGGQLGRSDLGEEDRLHLHYALGKALDDRGWHAAAFDHYVKGAQIRLRIACHDPGELPATLAQAKVAFSRSFFSKRRGWGCPAEDPIFIVGLPRSGSTLIEQILASHSMVEGTMELSDIGIIAKDLGWPSADYTAAVADLDAATAKALGECYLQRTRVYRELGLPRFVDKMPNNFQQLALIHLILPNAKIIDARRHPLAACFSAFKQHFAQGQDFSYDLGDLGRYYRDYVDIMDHVDRVLPGRVHRVIYEDLIENTEAEIRRLLDYCGLPFEEACLRFYDTDRAVRTVSSEQVRRPIFRDSLEQWRNHEAFLDPLKASLGDVLDYWRGTN
ncbi:tetratricopeptide repeat-containing sulfotransferase family protein [Caulobacter sp. S45]|uniref:tetratricopeptide repeat-containing sulfotransferase family protein n=1 Tax=Caulobacter sp. S45 TaxID=1641861 RepID=UPI00131B3D31|nr:tetratricopeptide repeat-containing sulfotransferase family protein [Caulobacter sp. S45]